MSWIKRLESKKLVTATPDDSVADAVERMLARNVGSVLVVEGGRLEGIFSERDLLARVVAPGKDPRATRLGSVCTRDPKVVREDADLAACARLVKCYGFRHIPVVDAVGIPVGLISARDFLGYVLEELESVVVNAYSDKRKQQMADPYELVPQDLA